MRIYETTFILSPQADDATFDRQIKSVSELITRYEGKIIHEDRWGIRRLAYPIRKFTQGYYTRMIFEGSNNLLAELDRFFRIEESYIRYLTVQFEGSLEQKYPEIHQGEEAAPAPAHHAASSGTASAAPVPAKIQDEAVPEKEDDEESESENMGPDEDVL